MRLVQLARIIRSTSEITVRVLPLPVAITRSARRSFFSNASDTRRIARCWYGRAAIEVLRERLPSGTRDVRG